MLRSYDAIRATTVPDRIVAAGQSWAAIAGGGPAYRAPWHWHDCLMILVPRLGTLSFRHEAQRGRIWLGADRFGMVPHAFVHETENARGDGTHLALYVSREGLVRLAARVGLPDAVRKARAPAMFQVTPEIAALRALCGRRAGQTGSEKAAEHHLAAALLLRCFDRIAASEPLPTATAADHGSAVVADIAAHVRANAAADLSLDRLAETFGLSRRHMTRLFKARTGRSIGAAQEAARLEEAARLLADTDLAVGEIAFRVGYESGSGLARALMRAKGLSPGAYRAAARTMARSALR